MNIESTSKDIFMCKECLQSYGTFNNAYKDQDFCVTCRIKKGQQILTQAEQMAFYVEDSIRNTGKKTDGNLTKAEKLGLFLKKFLIYKKTK